MAPIRSVLDHLYPDHGEPPSIAAANAAYKRAAKRARDAVQWTRLAMYLSAAMVHAMRTRQKRPNDRDALLLESRMKATCEMARRAMELRRPVAIPWPAEMLR